MGCLLGEERGRQQHVALVESVRCRCVCLGSFVPVYLYLYVHTFRRKKEDSECLVPEPENSTWHSPGWDPSAPRFPPLPHPEPSSGPDCSLPCRCGGALLLSQYELMFYSFKVHLFRDSDMLRKQKNHHLSLNQLAPSQGTCLGEGWDPSSPPGRQGLPPLDSPAVTGATTWLAVRALWLP